MVFSLCGAKGCQLNSLLLFSSPVYPKVKVREQEDYDDQYEFETRSLQSLKTPECFSLNDFSSPGKPLDLFTFLFSLLKNLFLMFLCLYCC